MLRPHAYPNRSSPPRPGRLRAGLGETAIPRRTAQTLAASDWLPLRLADDLEEKPGSNAGELMTRLRFRETGTPARRPNEGQIACWARKALQALARLGGSFSGPQFGAKEVPAAGVAMASVIRGEASESAFAPVRAANPGCAVRVVTASVQVRVARDPAGYRLDVRSLRGR